MNRLLANHMFCRLLWSLMFCAASAGELSAQTPAESRVETGDASTAETGGASTDEVPTSPAGLPTPPAATPPSRSAPAIPGIRGETARGESSPQVEEVKPVTYYVYDDQGELVPVLLDFSFEEFEELYRQREELEHPHRRPLYTLEEVQVGIDAAGETADFRVQFRFRCHDNTWTRVPLGLPETVLRQPPVYEGPGEFSLRYEEEAGGFVAWVNGPADVEHQVTLRLKASIEQRGVERLLRFSVPRATLSQLVATVDSPQASLVALRGATLSESDEPDPTRTRWSGLGLEGEVELLWRDSGTLETPAAGVLDVETNLLVNVRSQSSIRFEAYLKVRSYGETVDRFTVALPVGATLVPGEQPGYRTAVVAEAVSATGGQVVEVRLPRPTAEPVDVQLTADLALAEPDPQRWLEVGGFQVIEAARQSGYVALAVQGDWQVRWQAGETVRRVEVLPEVLLRDSVVAPFAFYSQPLSLEVRVFPRRTQMRVEPIYVVTVDDRELTLNARLLYKVREAKANFLDIELPDWDLESLGPSGLVKEDTLPPTDVQTVVIPLVQAMSGEFELNLTATRRLPSNISELRFDLPRPLADSHAATTVVIVPGSQLVLTPQSENLDGWVRDVLPSSIELPPEHAEPLVFRLEDPESATVFVADVERRRRETTVELDGQVSVGAAELEVIQSLRYSVKYEPIDQLLLQVPSALSAGSPISWWLADEPLEVALQPADTGEETAGSGDFLLKLPSPQIGSFEISARYVLPRENGGEGEGALRVPLLVPREAEISGNSLVVHSPSSMGVQVNDNRWHRPVPGELQLVADSAVASLALIVTPMQEAMPEAVRIDKIWLQTWITSQQRRERAVFHLESQASELRVTLADTLANESILHFSIDGRSVVPVGDPSGDWIVPIDTSEGSAGHVLEIIYHTNRSGGPGRITVQQPSISDSRGPYRLYWELVTMPGEVLLGEPAGMTNEADWRWAFVPVPILGHLPYPTRSPGWSQAEVEQWIGGTSQASPPPEANRYLLSTFDAPAELQFSTASRSLLVLGVSALVLAAGLLLLYFPRFANVKILFAVGLALAAVGVWHPPTALQLSRLAALGVALVIVARIIQSLMIWQRRPAVLGSTLPDSESRRTHMGPLPDEAGSGQTTATAPAPLPPAPLSAAESSR